MALAAWYTSSALAWLQTILKERFGHAFNLQPQPDGRNMVLSLPGDPRNITMALDGASFTRADSSLPCPKWNAAAEGWATPLGTDLPAPGASTLVSPLIEPNAQGWHIHYDILGLTYWMLTRQEEVGRTDLDAHGRFPASSSHAFKHGYLERPIVDEWLLLLGQVIRRTWPVLQLKQNTFSIRVSHDVDAPSRYGFANTKGLLRAMAGDVIKRGDIKNAIRAPWIRLKTRDSLHPADPFNTFEWIMDVSDQHGLTSAFYFICGRSSNMDADYEPVHLAIRALMRRIYERGHEIGLHPSYGSYLSPSIIANEAARLRRIATKEGIIQNEWGGRMHYLRWQNSVTPNAWEKAGLTYDSTLGYADWAGFRSGTSFEYPAFDPVLDHALRLRIRPLVAMECSVIDKCYMGLGVTEQAYRKFVQLKESVKAVGGTFTLLWHNSRLDNPAEREIYYRILES